ncbi:37S ribosomal protein S9, mitochondrial [Modicella reniformis]|uniref:Small ribosomal subunit protein uS9m n=1 Tax=Modicella reniformis TaxID=1440133 RepID=A0A9P6LZ29_9FUNG|nr:37S ribosomal protein S9, mitochondrial [Modicella reniformis]
MFSTRTLARTIVGSLSQSLQSSGRSVAKGLPPAIGVRFVSSESPPTYVTSQEEPINGYESLSGFQLKPASPSYFTTNPVYNELIVNLDYTYRQHRPFSKVLKQTQRPNWLGKDALTAAVGVKMLKTSQYRLVVSKLNQLATLTPRPASVEVLFSRFSKTDEQTVQKAKPKTVDHLGRAQAIGRRKEASASVYVVEGDGAILINGQDASQYFNKSQDRNLLLKPFEVTDLLGKYNVWALVKGGGTTGQAEAISLAIAKALLTHSPELKPVLRKADCITRDMRVVERKKPGQYKARKKFQWVKR